jgi:ParB/RepB/Spo0J family partition protein
VSQASVELELRFLETPYASLRIRSAMADSKLAASLAQHGQQSPISVVAGAREGQYVLIDGHARVRVLRRMGRETVKAQVLVVTAEQALLNVRVSWPGSTPTALEQAWLVAELAQVQGLTQLQLAALFGRSTKWVADRLALVEVLPASVRELVASGQLSEAVARRQLIAVARRCPAHAEALAQAIVHLGLTPAQCRRLARLYLDGSASLRQKLADNPVQILRAEQAHRASQQPSEDLLTGPERELIEHFEQARQDLEALAARLARTTIDGPSPELAQRLSAAWAGLQEATYTLTGVMGSVMPSPQGEPDDDRRTDSNPGLSDGPAGGGLAQDCQRAADLAPGSAAHLGQPLSEAAGVGTRQPPRASPGEDSLPLRPVQGQSHPGRRGVDPGTRRTDRLLDPDGLLQGPGLRSSSLDNALGPVRDGARSGDAARHLAGAHHGG